MPLYNFHSHTTHSDGGLSPVELLRWAVVGGYAALGVTAHAGLAELEFLAEQLGESCRLAQEGWGIQAIPGVGLTHLPPALIRDAARRANEARPGLGGVLGE